MLTSSVTFFTKFSVTLAVAVATSPEVRFAVSVTLVTFGGIVSTRLLTLKVASLESCDAWKESFTTTSR